MAKRKSDSEINRDVPEKVAEIALQPITETIEKNYMPYVMSVIISRAIPEIDGFKPSHRKLLYTMYRMGLMSGQRTKSANVVGQTMRLNPHGDSAIYETMVRLTRGNEALLHPFVDSKGSFGKVYSRDMAYAASRYTEVKLDPFCAELFRGIDKNAVDLVPNYDNTTTEPTLLPTTFPNVLVSPNIGIAVGMASNICSFNLREICEGTAALLKNPKLSLNDLMDIVKAPDFSTGGQLLYDPAEMKEIFRTGRGSFRLRSVYSYDKKENCIDILQIPYTTSIEAIMKRISDLVKEGSLKEIADFRDEIDLSGFKLTIDLRRGTDPEALMKKLFRLTPLEDEFSCNFNILIGSTPRQLGVLEILKEWIHFRSQTLSRELTFEWNRKRDKLHLLLGLGKILLDIDRAIAIVRGTERDEDVVPNLMKGFSIDEVQAEYIAEIKLRNLNRAYIIERIREIESLQKEIADLRATIDSEVKLRHLIAKQLTEIAEKFGKPRKTQLVHGVMREVEALEEPVPDYPVRVVLSRDGYLKKITMASLRGSDELKFKEGDSLRYSEDASNADEMIFFSDRCHAFCIRLDDFEAGKASGMGDFVPAKLGFESGERCICGKAFSSRSEATGWFVFLFENGKGVRIPCSAYETKSNRRRLTGAYSGASPIVGAFYVPEKKPVPLLLFASNGKGMILSSDLIPEKSTRTAAGVTLMTLKAGAKLTGAYASPDRVLSDLTGLRKLKIPSSGVGLPADFPYPDHI
ncbi:MAG: topoisomerase IV [Clostridia bacterium]|nr:topoisomerase IV [Clostridia bacterium]